MSRVEKVRVGWDSNYFFSVCFPTRTFSTLLVYLAPKSTNDKIAASFDLLIV